MTDFELAFKNAYPDYEDSKIDENELLMMRQIRTKELQLIKFIKEILFYASFTWILLVVSYSNKDINSYRYQKSIKMILSSTGKGHFDIHGVLSFLFKIFYTFLELVF